MNDSLVRCTEKQVCSREEADLDKRELIEQERERERESPER